MRLLTIAPLLLAVSALGACQQSAAPPAAQAAQRGVTISDARLVMPILSGNPAAAYFTLTNGSGKAIALTGVAVAGGEMAMMHETVEQDGHSSMNMLDSVPVPASGAVAFAPGGKHVMISGLAPELKVGGKTALTITLADGSTINADLAITAQSPASE